MALEVVQQQSMKALSGHKVTCFAVRRKLATVAYAYGTAKVDNIKDCEKQKPMERPAWTTTVQRENPHPPLAVIACIEGGFSSKCSGSLSKENSFNSR